MNKKNKLCGIKRIEENPGLANWHRHGVSGMEKGAKTQLLNHSSSMRAPL